MPDILLQPSTVTRLLHLLQAAQPFLTPCWCRLADMCIRLLNISELFVTPRRMNLTGLIRDIRGCTPSDDMSALLCAIRPFCSDEELRMLQMYEQFQQMQKMMDMWKIFSDLMPDSNNAGGTSGNASFDNLAGLFRSFSDGNGFDDILSNFMNSQNTSRKAEAQTPEPTESEDCSRCSSGNTEPSAPCGEQQSTPDANPLLSFLSPEQLSLYNSILSD